MRGGLRQHHLPAGGEGSGAAVLPRRGLPPLPLPAERRGHRQPALLHPTPNSGLLHGDRASLLPLRPGSLLRRLRLQRLHRVFHGPRHRLRKRCQNKRGLRGEPHTPVGRSLCILPDPRHRSRALTTAAEAEAEVLRHPAQHAPLLRALHHRRARGGHGLPFR